MNPHREALLAARATIDEGRADFICIALDVAPGRLDGAAVGDLHERIYSELAGCQDFLGPTILPMTLEDWLLAQGIFPTPGQAHMARLAWIDRMLEDYP